MADPDLGTAPLETIVDALRAGRLSAAAIADWAVANHEARGEAFHAYKTFDAGRVRAEAEVADAARASRNDLGPLQGIPVSIKDLFGVAGYPTFAGSPAHPSPPASDHIRQPSHRSVTVPPNCSTVDERARNVS